MMHITIQQHLETMATIAGLLNIYLAARVNIWNWFFGIIMVSLYTIIFYHVKLYADMSLQGVYFILQFYGIYQWLFGGMKHSALPVTKATIEIYFTATMLTTAIFLTIAYLLHRYTDSTTVTIDAFTTALSLVAQWMMCKKWLENWWLWMIVDAISIKMYIFKHLYLTAGLYGVFFIVCVYGYYAWRTQVVSFTQYRAKTLLTNADSA